MARLLSINDSVSSNLSSPEGFWHVPKETPKKTGVKSPRVKFSNVPEEEHGRYNISITEGIPPINDLEATQPISSPTWTVPKRRKSRKKKGRKFYFYDTTEEDICFSNGGEVTTKNRFSVLEDTSCHEKKESPTRSNKKEDTSHSEVLYDFYGWQEVRNITYASYDNYLLNNQILHNSVTYKLTKYNIFLYSNKYNLCSGYFPDFITLDDNVFKDLYSDKNIPKYYPYIFNGKYLKQISNSESKFNNKYFSKMKSAYDISKKFWGNPSPSSGIGTKGSGIGTQGENKDCRYSGIGEPTVNANYKIKVINKPSHKNKQNIKQSNLNTNSININDSNNSNNNNNNNDISIKTLNPVYPNSPYAPNHEDIPGGEVRLPKQGHKYKYNTQECTHGGGGGWR